MIDQRFEYQQISEEDFEALVDLSVGSDYFSCEVCRLVLDSYELLEQAGVSTEFNVPGDPGEYFEAEYGND